MTSPNTVAIVALGVAIVALAVALYTLHKVRKLATAASSMWDRASWVWQNIPHEHRDRIKRRVSQLADEGITQLETLKPTFTYA